MHIETSKDICYYGPPEYQCRMCGAQFWYQERCKRDSAITQRRMSYSLCCKGGKIFVPPFAQPPEPLNSLLKFDGDARSRHCLQHIRQYNSLFAFTSMGANIDDSLNRGGGPYVFKINGQVHHRIGSLLPSEETPLKFAQLYIYYDTQNEIENRMRALLNEEVEDCDLDPQIAAELLDMLDNCNPLVKQFRIARDRLADNGDEQFAIRIVGSDENGPVQYELPTADELAGLIVGDFSLENAKRDIIVQSIPGPLHVSSLHPAYMALQYPLLFPYGERGFQLGYKFKRGRLESYRYTNKGFYARALLLLLPLSSRSI